MIHNNVTGRSYIGSSHCIEYRMSHHLSALKSHRHPNRDMQDDCDTYGIDSFTFRPLFCTDDSKKTDVEHFLMDVLRTHDERYGYNHRDKGGTGKYLTREMHRTVHEGYWKAHIPQGTYESFHQKRKRLELVDASKCTDKQKQCIDICLQSESFADTARKLKVSRQAVHDMVSKILDAKRGVT